VDEVGWEPVKLEDMETKGIEVVANGAQGWLSGLVLRCSAHSHRGRL